MTLPIARRRSWGKSAPVHVRSTLPSLARTRETEPLASETQTLVPSLWTFSGAAETVAIERAWMFCGVQKRFMAIRRLPRCRTPSTVRERNAAIWRRLTLLAGSKVVAVVPVVIPRVKISNTNGQKASAATSVKGPQVDSAEPAPPVNTVAARAGTQKHESRRDRVRTMNSPPKTYSRPRPGARKNGAHALAPHAVAR